MKYKIHFKALDNTFDSRLDHIKEWADHNGYAIEKESYPTVTIKRIKSVGEAYSIKIHFDFVKDTAVKEKIDIRNNRSIFEAPYEDWALDFATMDKGFKPVDDRGWSFNKLKDHIRTYMTKTLGCEEFVDQSGYRRWYVHWAENEVDYDTVYEVHIAAKEITKEVGHYDSSYPSPHQVRPEAQEKLTEDEMMFFDDLDFQLSYRQRKETKQTIMDWV